MSDRKTLDMSRSKLIVKTFKEGLLSKLAHDLVIEATEANGHLEDGRVEIQVKTLSLAVVSDNVSSSQKEEIQGNMRKTVLDTKRYDTVTVRLDGLDNGNATLEIKGRRNTVPVRCQWDEENGHLKVSAAIQQSAFGIKPYSAMLGALKIQDRVELEGELYFS